MYESVKIKLKTEHQKSKPNTIFAPLPHQAAFNTCALTVGQELHMFRHAFSEDPPCTRCFTWTEASSGLLHASF